MKSRSPSFRFAGSLLLAGLASLWSACQSHAANTTIGPATEATTTTSSDDDGPPPSQLTLKPYGIYQFPADWTNGSSVSSSHSGVSAEYSLPVLPYTILDLSVTGEYSHYSLTNTLDVLPASKLSVDGYATRIAPSLGFAASDKLILIGGGFVQSTSQFGAGFNHSLTYGGFGGAVWRLSDKLTITVGTAVSTRLNASDQVLPFGGVDWQINDKWKLGGEATDFGGTFRLTRQLTPQWSASLFAGFAQREFRLDPQAAISNGILRDSFAPVGVELAWKLSDHALVRFDTGFSAYEQLRIDDHAGNQIAKRNVDPAPFVGVTASFVF